MLRQEYQHPNRASSFRHFFRLGLLDLAHVPRLDRIPLSAEKVVSIYSYLSIHLCMYRSDLSLHMSLESESSFFGYVYV